MVELDLILAAMLALTPEQARPVEGSKAAATYRQIADDIYEASHNPLRDLPFEGPAAILATEYALVAISANESAFNAKVRDCTIIGYPGRSISIFQIALGPTRGGFKEKDICSNPVLAAKLAVDILTWYRAVPKAEQLFSGYATGNPSKTNYAAGRQFRFFKQLLARSNIRVVRKPGSSKFFAELTDDTNNTVIHSPNDSWPGLIPVSSQ